MLEERIASLSGGCTAKVQRFAEEVASGATKAAAARAAGLSSKGGAPWRVLERSEVVELVGLLRERARRDAQVTLAGQIARIQRLGRDAEAKGDHGAALRAEDMINKLSNLYPDTRLRLAVEHEVNLRDVTPEELEALAKLRHEVRPQLAAHAVVVDATALEVVPEVNREEDLSDVLC